MKRTHLMKRAIAIGVVGAMAICESVPAVAAPVLSSTVVVTSTAPNSLEQVRARRNRGGAIGAGIALGVFGAMAGAAVAAQNPYYYGPGYYGDPGYYGPGYYGPGYYEPAYDPGAAIALGVIGAAAGAIANAPYAGGRRGQCWVTTDQDRNLGYWGRCR